MVDNEDYQDEIDEAMAMVNSSQMAMEGDEEESFSAKEIQEATRQATSIVSSLLGGLGKPEPTSTYEDDIERFKNDPDMFFNKYQEIHPYYEEEPEEIPEKKTAPPLPAPRNSKKVLTAEIEEDYEEDLDSKRKKLKEHLLKETPLPKVAKKLNIPNVSKMKDKDVEARLNYYDSIKIRKSNEAIVNVLTEVVGNTSGYLLGLDIMGDIKGNDMFKKILENCLPNSFLLGMSPYVALMVLLSVVMINAYLKKRDAQLQQVPPKVVDISKQDQT